MIRQIGLGESGKLSSTSPLALIGLPVELAPAVCVSSSGRASLGQGIVNSLLCGVQNMLWS